MNEVIYLNQKPLKRHLIPSLVLFVLTALLADAPFQDIKDRILGIVALGFMGLVCVGFYLLPLLFNRVKAQKGDWGDTLAFFVYRNFPAAWVRILFWWRSVVLGMFEFVCLLLILARFMQMLEFPFEPLVPYVPLLGLYIFLSASLRTAIEWKCLGENPTRIVRK